MSGKMNWKGYLLIAAGLAVLVSFTYYLWAMSENAKAKYDNLLVRDMHGNFYLIEHHIGQTFKISEVPKWEEPAEAKGDSDK